MHLHVDPAPVGPELRPKHFLSAPDAADAARAMGIARPLTRRARIRLFPPVHAFWYATRWIGLRDRLRCPYCKAVGTWKPHGTFTARLFDHDRPVRRWLCKFCGKYEGPEGIVDAFPCPTRHVWALPQPLDMNSAPEAGPTPQRAVKAALDKTWPWRG